MALLVRLAEQVQIYEALVYLLLTHDHTLGKSHVVMRPVAELSVLAGHVVLVRVSNDHLTHLVDEVGLPPR